MQKCGFHEICKGSMATYSVDFSVFSNDTIEGKSIIVYYCIFFVYIVLVVVNEMIGTALFPPF